MTTPKAALGTERKDTSPVLTDVKKAMALDEHTVKRIAIDDPDFEPLWGDEGQQLETDILTLGDDVSPRFSTRRKHLKNACRAPTKA